MRSRKRRPPQNRKKLGGYESGKREPRRLFSQTEFFVHWLRERIFFVADVRLLLVEEAGYKVYGSIGGTSICLCIIERERICRSDGVGELLFLVIIDAVKGSHEVAVAECRVRLTVGIDDLINLLVGGAVLVLMKESKELVKIHASNADFVQNVLPRRTVGKN